MGSATIFERMGGFARVRLIVSDFYDKVLESDRLARYFVDVDMRRLIDHQTKFISAVMGGPAAFSDEQLARAHLRLGITPADFDEMAGYFHETLEDHGVDATELERLQAHLLSMREHVVARRPELRP
jgi:hemoglobin